jgi:hypothetical protein
MFMTPLDLAALVDIRGYAAVGRVVVTAHARARMLERNVQSGDLRSALSSAHDCKADRDGKWRVTGPDLDGDDLTVVVAIEDGVVVVTLF